MHFQLCAITALLTLTSAAVVNRSSGPSNVDGGAQNCPPAFNNVMTIVFENEGNSDVMNDPYFGSNLTSRGYYLSNMNGVWHPSQPNYLAMISGSTKWVLADYDVNLDGNTIVDLLEAKGLTWKSYQEDYEGVCNTASRIKDYARKHNPFISFKNIQQNPARCANIVNSAQLDVDAANNALPNYMFFTPNLKNDGHDTNIPTASAWLQAFLEPKLADPAYADTLFIVTFDESKWYIGNSIYTVLLGKGIVGAVVLALENNSFDRILGYWAHKKQNVNGTPQNATQFCPQNGQTLTVDPNLPLQALAGPEHGIDFVTTQIYGPGVSTMDAKNHVPNMSGFCAAYPESSDSTVLHQVIDGFAPEQVPVYTTLADEYAVFDSWFAGVPGPTIPNRLFLMSASSHNDTEVQTSNPISGDLKGYPGKSIFRNLDESSISWTNYWMEVPTPIIMRDTRHFRNINRFKTFNKFYDDPKAGQLAQFVWLDPNYANGNTVWKIFGEPNDGSPGSDFARAEALLKSIYEALVASPQWKHTLFIVTFDEHGGAYDHVPPPTTGIPSPEPIAENSKIFKFDRLGVRVPTLLISPWIQKGTVISKPNFPSPNAHFEHSSLSATIKNIFNLPDFLTKRDAVAATFDDFTRILHEPRQDCLKVLLENKPFANPNVGLIPDVQKVITDLNEIAKDLFNLFN
ncbi:hypothetical protein HDU76_005929 [Blyttiomyces sp. JEL0837]|nr:hypothetical protein HDU76_005929 [Blyttiomyces sp. JEL0837]